MQYKPLHDIANEFQDNVPDVVRGRLHRYGQFHVTPKIGPVTLEVCFSKGYVMVYLRKNPEGKIKNTHYIRKKECDALWKLIKKFNGKMMFRRANEDTWVYYSDLTYPDDGLTNY